MKYSCSAPTDGTTLCDVVLPKSLSILSACVFIACMERSSGVFLSSASPLYEQNAVGMYNVTPSESFFKNAGEVQSHAVYPLASNVALRPPEGKLEASDSPFVSSLAENSIITLPFFGAEIKESCFSAVTPVSG